jgi:hypothetical protein
MSADDNDVWDTRVDLGTSEGRRMLGAYILSKDGLLQLAAAVTQLEAALQSEELVSGTVAAGHMERLQRIRYEWPEFDQLDALRQDAVAGWRLPSSQRRWLRRILVAPTIKLKIPTAGEDVTAACVEELRRVRSGLALGRIAVGARQLAEAAVALLQEIGFPDATYPSACADFGFEETP